MTDVAAPHINPQIGGGGGQRNGFGNPGCQFDLLLKCAVWIDTRHHRAGRGTGEIHLNLYRCRCHRGQRHCHRPPRVRRQQRCCSTLQCCTCRLCIGKQTEFIPIPCTARLDAPQRSAPQIDDVLALPYKVCSPIRQRTAAIAEGDRIINEQQWSCCCTIDNCHLCECHRQRIWSAIFGRRLVQIIIGNGDEIPFGQFGQRVGTRCTFRPVGAVVLELT